MINYTDLKDWLLEVARRHPNLRFCEFDTSVEAYNDPDFVCPAFIISPSTTRLIDNNGVISYGFDLLYMDKLRQEDEADEKAEILEAGIQFLIGYLQVIDLEYKVLTGASLEPMKTEEGAYMIGVGTFIEIEDQYNLDKFMSVFYG
jgi:hypothetical protein